jgi:aminoglycoside phosphotransferase (APT) family kinase protein
LKRGVLSLCAAETEDTLFFMFPEHEALFHKLQNYLSEQFGQAVSITDAKPLSGGASRDTWHISVNLGETPRQMVLRRDLPTQMFEEALSREEEFRLMDAAYQAGVKLAKVAFLCTDKTVLGSDFFLMDYVGGISIGRKVVTDPALASARAVLPQQMAEELAKIHRMDASQLSFLKQPSEGRSAAEESLYQTYLILDNLGVQNPVWEWTLRWAKNHIPEANPLCFAHGDFRIGNLLVNEQGLAAVIDWEFGHIGDPDEELGYLCMRDWRFGITQHQMAGLSDRESFLVAYEAASGRKVSRASVDWWEVMGNIRWGIICMSQANRHLSGAEKSVELASLGRRSAEMQLESLRLIERIGY